MSKTILITRPKAQTEKTAHDFAVLGFQTLCCPLLTIEPVPYDMPDVTQYDAVIITSQNACAFVDFSSIPMNTRFICVGETTKDILNKKGYHYVMYGYQSASDIPLAPNQKYVHFRGQHVHHIFDPAQCDSCIVYDTIMTEAFSNIIIEAFKNNTINLVTLYSKRTAKCFNKRIREYNMSQYLNQIDVLCISQNVLDCVYSLPWQNTYTARTPDHHGVIDMAEAIYHDDT